MFAIEHSGVEPDILTFAKGIANGTPVGGFITSDKIAASYTKPGASTFGGNPVACAAAMATLATIEQEQLCERAELLGTRLLEQFSLALADCDTVKDIRGKGLMIGIELTQPCAELVGQAAAVGLLINVTANKVIRLLPPLNFSDEQAEQLVQLLVPLIKAFPAEG